MKFATFALLLSSASAVAAVAAHDGSDSSSYTDDQGLGSPVSTSDRSAPSRHSDGGHDGSSPSYASRGAAHDGSDSSRYADDQGLGSPVSASDRSAPSQRSDEGHDESSPSYASRGGQRPPHRPSSSSRDYPGNATSNHRPSTLQDAEDAGGASDGQIRSSSRPPSYPSGKLGNLLGQQTGKGACYHQQACKMTT